MRNLQRHLERTCKLFTAVVIGGLTGRSLGIYWGYMPLSMTCNPIEWTLAAYGFIAFSLIGSMIIERTPETW